MTSSGSSGSCATSPSGTSVRTPTPWAVDDAPADFLAAMLRGIVGVEIAVERLEGKRKLSQNRSDEDQRGAVAGLDAVGAPRSAAVADAMRRQLT